MRLTFVVFAFLGDLEVKAHQISLVTWEKTRDSPRKTTKPPTSCSSRNSLACVLCQA